MNSQINGVLVQIREGLFEGVAWGPEIPEPPEDSHIQGNAGVGGAENIHDAGDHFDHYLGNIVDSLVDHYDLDPEEALDLVFSVADNMAGEGRMPPVPEDDDDNVLAQWLGAAKSAGFHHEVLAAALGEQ